MITLTCRLTRSDRLQAPEGARIGIAPRDIQSSRFVPQRSRFPRGHAERHSCGWNPFRAILGKESDHRHRQLLRVRGQRLRRRGGAQPCDELPPPWEPAVPAAPEHRRDGLRTRMADRAASSREMRLCRRGSRSNRPLGSGSLQHSSDHNKQVLSGMHSYIRRVDRQRIRNSPIAAARVRRGGCDRRPADSTGRT